MFRTTLSFLLCLAAAAGAQAQEGVYGGVLVTRTTISVDESDVNPIAIGFKVGTAINKNFAVEGRVGAGLADDSVGFTNVKVNNYIGVYGKGILPLSDKASLYGLAGYTRGKLTSEVPGIISVSVSDSDFSYGVGGDFSLTPTTSLNVEYARLFKGDNYKVDGLTLGISFKF